MRPTLTRVIAASMVSVCLMGALVRLGAWPAPLRAQTAAGHKWVWHGHIDDERASVSRALSGGGVPRMPNPFSYAHAISVDFEYVQQVEADGSVTWPKRHLSWTLQGTEGDDTFTETCRGGGSLDLAPARDTATLTTAEQTALQARCERGKLATAFRLYESLPQAPPLPTIPGVEALDDNCAYREEVGSRRTSVWLTPDVDAVVEMDVTTGSPYQRWVPEPGKTIELMVRTVPAYPARFRFVIDKEHTSNFAGYAGNAYVDSSFFKRYHVEHLSTTYTDLSPDLIFDPHMLDERAWSRGEPDVVETRSDDGAAATAHVTAMDYGAIGKIRAFAKFKCGGWTPAKIVVGGKPHDAVSVPLDEDNNLMADALEDYTGDPGRDDDAEPEGDGTKGDGLTAFEEYRGFMTEGSSCDDRMMDVHVRTTPRHKHLFVDAGTPELERHVEAFGWAADLSVIHVCDEHLWGIDDLVTALNSEFKGQTSPSVPSDSRVINFTLQRAKQRRFDGRVVSQDEPQHGVYVALVPNWSIADPLGLTVTSDGDPASLGPPRLTAAVFVQKRLLTGVLGSGERRSDLSLAVRHELGHAVGVPHHADGRAAWRIKSGMWDITVDSSPLLRAGRPPDPEEAVAPDSEKPDALLVDPGPGCTEASHEAVSQKGELIGCLTTLIVRRGQQRSGDVSCPMRYQDQDFYDPRGSGVSFRGTRRLTLTQLPDPTVDPHTYGGKYTVTADSWSGQVDKWPSDYNRPETWGAGKFCESPRGTGVNSRFAPRNLAGDAGRDACRSFIVVNDVAPGDPKSGFAGKP